MWLTVPLFPLVRTHRYRMTTKFSSNASTVWPTLSKIQAPKRPNKGDESVCWKQIFRRSALRARREPDQFLTSDRGILSALRSTRIGSPSIFDITKLPAVNISACTYAVVCFPLTGRHQTQNKTLYINLTIEGHCPPKTCPNENPQTPIMMYMSKKNFFLYSAAALLSPFATAAEVCLAHLSVSLVATSLYGLGPVRCHSLSSPVAS